MKVYHRTKFIYFIFTAQHFCHEAMNNFLPCDLNTVDILYLDKFETTDTHSSQDRGLNNLQCFRILS